MFMCIILLYMYHLYTYILYTVRRRVVYYKVVCWGYILYYIYIIWELIQSERQRLCAFRCRRPGYIIAWKITSERAYTICTSYTVDPSHNYSRATAVGVYIRGPGVRVYTRDVCGRGKRARERFPGGFYYNGERGAVWCVRSRTRIVPMYIHTTSIYEGARVRVFVFIYTLNITLWIEKGWRWMRVARAGSGEGLKEEN